MSPKLPPPPPPRPRAIVALPRPGAVVNDSYTLIREIGAGGYGVVFEAEQESLKRRVAIKMLKPGSLIMPEIPQRFQREARLISSLKSPHSTVVFGYGMHGETETVQGLPYIVMEYLDGSDLGALLARHGRFSLALTVTILIQVLKSLSEAHDIGIVHRDLKPENIFLARTRYGDKVVKVLDFGIARAISGDWGPRTMERLTQAGMVCGTPAFMAPEQATGAPDLTPAVDVYALGGIAYLMLTGHLLFEAGNAAEMALKHVTNPIPVFPAPIEGSPIGAVLHKALAKKPEHRFRSALEFMLELEEMARVLGLDTTLALPDRGEHTPILERPTQEASPLLQPAPSRPPSSSSRPPRLPSVATPPPLPSNPAMRSSPKPALPPLSPPPKPASKSPPRLSPPPPSAPAFPFADTIQLPEQAPEGPGALSVTSEPAIEIQVASEPVQIVPFTIPTETQPAQIDPLMQIEPITAIMPQVTPPPAKDGTKTIWALLAGIVVLCFVLGGLAVAILGYTPAEPETIELPPMGASKEAAPPGESSAQEAPDDEAPSGKVPAGEVAKEAGDAPDAGDKDPAGESAKAPPEADAGDEKAATEKDAAEKTAELVVLCRPATLDVFIGEDGPHRCGAVIPVEPGSHKVSLRGGDKEATRSVKLKAKQRLQIAVALD